MRRTPSRPSAASPSRGSLRGSPQLRLRFGFLVIAMVLSVFGARLVQLQGVDPNAYAAMAAAEGTVTLDLPAERGDILDRNGRPLADSVDGAMVVADPAADPGQGARARQVPGRPARRRLLRDPQGAAPEGQAVRLHRPPRAGQQGRGRGRRRRGGRLRGPRHPPRPGPRLPGRRRGGQPGRLHGHRRGPGRLRAQLRRACWPARTARSATPSASATGSRSARPPSSRPSTARTCRPPSTSTSSGTPSACCARRVEDARADSGFAVVMDTETGEVLALADDPTFDARDPQVREGQGRPGLPRDDRRLRARLGREGAHPQCAHRRRQGHRQDARRRAAQPGQRRPGHPRLVRPRHPATDAGRRASRSPPTSARCWPRRNFETGQLRDYLTEVRPRPEDRRGHRRRDPGHPARPEHLDVDDAGPHRVRPVAVGQRHADGRRGQHHRQRRGPRLAQPDPRHGRHRRRSRRSAPTPPPPSGWSARGPRTR